MGTVVAEIGTRVGWSHVSERILQTPQSRNQPHAVAVEERLISTRTPKVLLEGCRLDRGPETGAGLAGVVASAAGDQQSHSGRPASLSVKLVIFLLSIGVGVQLRQRHTMPATDPPAIQVATPLIRYFTH